MTTDDAVAKVQSALRDMGFEETSATDAEADSGKDGVANG